MSRSPMAALIVAALLLGGCGGPDAFDPAGSRPCDFLTAEDLEKYALVVALEETNKCVFGKKPMWEDTLTGITVQYRNEPADLVAAPLHLAAVTGEEAEDTRIAYRSSAKIDIYQKGTCRMLVPYGKDSTMDIAVGIDLSGVRWYAQERIDDPCAYMAYEHGYPEILDKLA